MNIYITKLEVGFVKLEKLITFPLRGSLQIGGVQTKYQNFPSFPLQRLMELDLQ